MPSMSVLRQYVELTFDEKIWLTKHGDRSQKDVEVDEHGRKFVLMYDPDGFGKAERVYIDV
jgi:hypothetical protein